MRMLLPHLSLVEVEELCHRLSFLASDFRSIAFARRCGNADLMRHIDETKMLYDCLETGDLLREVTGVPADLAPLSIASLPILHIKE